MTTISNHPELVAHVANTTLFNATRLKRKYQKFDDPNPTFGKLSVPAIATKDARQVDAIAGDTDVVVLAYNCLMTEHWVWAGKGYDFHREWEVD